MISRIRWYPNYDEAVREWRYFGLPDLAPNATDLLGSIIVFVEGAEPSAIDELMFEVRDLGGKAFRCDGTVSRLVLMGAPNMYWELLNSEFGSFVYDSIVQSVSVPAPLKLRHGTLKFNRTIVMGVLNVTPDSFSDGGRFLKKDDAVKRALSMADEGADIIDIGGESTRPNAVPVSMKEELERVVPVIKEVIPSLSVPVSIDTTKPEVAAEALDQGASMINDVFGLRNDDMIMAAINEEVPAIAMHMRGDPRTMQAGIRYDDVVGDISLYLEERMERAEALGMKRNMIVLDPGLGFGKRLEDNLAIVRRLREFKSLGRPLVIGPSRKSFIGKVLITPEGGRMIGTMAAVTAAIMNGANIVRVHDVKEAVETARMTDAILSTIKP